MVDNLKKHGNRWKGGRSSCSVCGKKLSNYTSKVCRNHRTLSEEHRSKISFAKIGKQYHLGLKHSEDSKKKISLALSGKPGLKGELNHSWKGGVSLNIKYQKDYLKNLRKSVLEALGGKCLKCGFDDIRALQIDHVNGGGSKERKSREYKGSFHSNVLKSFLAKEDKYQLLCANCNWIKRFENNEAKGRFVN